MRRETPKMQVERTMTRATGRQPNAVERRISPKSGGAHRSAISPIGLAQVGVAVLIAIGWSMRGERWLIPDRGIGYALGVVGLGAMVVLLAYPIRKRVRVLRRTGRISTWFQVHMLLGLIGPLAILYHSNFRLGSTNANVALLCVLAVAGSGVVGRVIYVRIHAGLAGRRRTLSDIRDDLISSQDALAMASISDDVIARLAQFEHGLLESCKAPHRRLTRRLGAGQAARRTLRDVRRLVQGEGGRVAPDSIRVERATMKVARRYVGTVRSVASFQTWERLFAFWHLAHLPLCVLLFATAAVHVVAVHLY